MTNSPTSETQPSVISEKNLQIDFFESGIGETIIITFPDGGIGIVDAHPSQDEGRMPISEIASGKNIHFICMTHPHADHGKDLIPLLESHPNIGEFWHTLSDVSVFVFAEGGQIQNYRSPIHEAAAEFQAGWGKFLIKIYGNVAKRKIPLHKLRSDLEAQTIAGVSLHFLSPDEQEQNRFTTAYQEIAGGKRSGYPDPNGLSAIMALEYGGSVILLGADALKKNWDGASKKYRRLKLAKAAVLKVPHHGASNAIDLRKGKDSYLDLCSSSTLSILFAGDSNHPDTRVQEKLDSKTIPACLINGTCCARPAPDQNPLGLLIPGAKAVKQEISSCQTQISVEVTSSGDCNLTRGFKCMDCPKSR